MALKRDVRGYFMCPDHFQWIRERTYASGEIICWRGHCYRARQHTCGHDPSPGGNESWEMYDHLGNGHLAQLHLADRKPEWSALHICLHDDFQDNTLYHPGAHVFYQDRCWRRAADCYSANLPPLATLDWQRVNACRRPPLFPGALFPEPDAEPERMIVRSRLDMLEF